MKTIFFLVIGLVFSFTTQCAQQSYRPVPPGLVQTGLIILNDEVILPKGLLESILPHNRSLHFLDIHAKSITASMRRIALKERQQIVI